MVVLICPRLVLSKDALLVQSCLIFSWMIQAGTSWPCVLWLEPKLSLGMTVPNREYADDVLLMPDSPAELQQLLDRTEDYCAAVGLLISTDKTCLQIFSSTTSLPHHVRTCFGETFEVQTKHTSLGIMIDSTSGIDFSFTHLYKKQIGAWAIRKQQYAALHASRSIALTNHLYRTCVSSAASYACEAWGLRELTAWP